MHHNPVDALLRDHRLGNAELVDAVVQRDHVLLERLVLNAPRRQRLNARSQPGFGTINRFDRLQFGKLFGDHALGGVERLRIAQPDVDGLAATADAAVADVLFAQRGAQVTRQRLGLLGQRRLHIDLQHKVNPAAQIQAKVHRRSAEFGQPGG